jgi:hypothetical protein
MVFQYALSLVRNINIWWMLKCGSWGGVARQDPVMAMLGKAIKQYLFLRCIL